MHAPPIGLQDKHIFLSQFDPVQPLKHYMVFESFKSIPCFIIFLSHFFLLQLGWHLH